MRIAVSWHPHSIRQSFQCLVKVTGGLVIPDLQTGVHPCGILPLLRLLIVLIVTAVLQRELIDGLRLLMNVLSLLLILTTGELCSVMFASVLEGLLMVVWC